MTLVKINNRPAQKSFNKLVDDFFYGTPSIIMNEALSQSVKSNVPVNIFETEQSFELHVIAPGFDKDAFKISLDKNLLSIAAEYKDKKEEQKEKQIRKEFRYQSFTRMFTLNETIDAEKIEAKYENGVLQVHLPKKAEVKEPVKQITIK